MIILRRLVFVVLLGIVSAVLIVAGLNIPGFRECGFLGYGWKPVDAGLPCGWMGVLESGCCYRADGADHMVMMFLGILPIPALLLGIVYMWYGPIYRAWVDRQLGLR